MAVVDKTTPETSRFQYFFDREGVLGSIMLFPAVIYVVLLVGFPFALAIAYSFSDVTIGDQSLDFVGFQTFREVISDDVFQKSLQNTFIFTIISQVLVLVLAKILALVLIQDFPGKWVFRFLILLPWATPIALGTIGWLYMLDSLYSPIDWIFREVGLLGIDGAWGPQRNMYWLGKRNLAMASVITVHIWRMLPLATVIILAGLTSIPKDIKDAVAIDGVGYFRELFEVTIPLMLPIMMVATLFGIVFTFTDMTVVFVLTRGGPPVHNTQVLASWAYFKGIEGGDLAQGAATAIFLFPLLLAVAILMLRVASRSEVT